MESVDCEKICRKCGVSKILNKDNFYFYWYNGSRYCKSWCRECILLSRKLNYDKDKVKQKIRLDKYRAANRDKIIERMREYNSRPEVKRSQKKYREDNRKILRQKEKAWREKNPEKAREIIRRKMKKRNKKPLIRIRTAISRGIGLALKRNGSSKAGDSIMNHLEFTIDELKSYLESLFEPWMNWSNYGVYTRKWDDENPNTWTWQIDHIIPHSEFEYDSMDHPQFKECWKLSNLRPYSSKKNCLDGCNRVRHKKTKGSV